MTIFSKVGEKEVTRAIINGFAKQFNEYADSDVIEIGAGPSGLMCSRELARKGVKTLVIENNNYLGGGSMYAVGYSAEVVAENPADAPPCH
ncbi:MAG: hypothetical protein CVT48_06895 [Thermoplasmata archaeon HGW-Thermoplasmata-1]|nr:MAG: hypothetical protein CVT48_06895 [Thermoplasmata archaeon HGW-Thermoplasmata-1]